MRLLITRPEPNASELALKVEALGHQTHIEPLMSVKFIEDETIDGDFSAIILTSQNTVKALVHQNSITKYLDTPVFAVGNTTTKAAKEAGFNQVFEGSGNVQSLLPEIIKQVSTGAFPILYPSGEDIAYDIGKDLELAGYTYVRQVLYKTVAATSFSDKLTNLIHYGELDGVILLSPKTSAIWASLITDNQNIVRQSPITAYCLSTAIAEPLKKIKNMPKRLLRNQILRIY